MKRKKILWVLKTCEASLLSSIEHKTKSYLKKLISFYILTQQSKFKWRDSKIQPPISLNKPKTLPIFITTKFPNSWTPCSIRTNACCAKINTIMKIEYPGSWYTVATLSAHLVSLNSTRIQALNLEIEGWGVPCVWN